MNQKWWGSACIVAFAVSWSVAAQDKVELPQSGSTNVTGYFQLSVLESIDMGPLGTHNAHLLDGYIRNGNGDPYFENMTAKCVVHHQQTPDAFGIRYSCAFIDIDGDRIYFLGEDNTGEGGPASQIGGTGKYEQFDFTMPSLDVELIFGTEQQLKGLVVDYGLTWQSG